MKTVMEVSRMTGVSVRTLHYYDSIGLLRPSRITESGYRLYDDDALLKLQNILLFKELKFPLKEIAEILASPDFDGEKALEQQIKLLEMQKEHISNLITFARGIQLTGVRNLDFSAFDKSKIDDYAAQAKALWGNTEAFREFEARSEGRTKDEQQSINEGLMDIFRRFGEVKSQPADSSTAQELVNELKQYITKHFYTCTSEILAGLGNMYVSDSSFSENIDTAGGKGTAQFAAKAIEIFTGR